MPVRCNGTCNGIWGMIEINHDLYPTHSSTMRGFEWALLHRTYDLPYSSYEYNQHYPNMKSSVRVIVLGTDEIWIKRFFTIS